MHHRLRLDLVVALGLVGCGMEPAPGQDDEWVTQGSDLASALTPGSGHTLTFPGFSRVGLRWDLAPGSAARLEVRTSEGGDWTAWAPVETTWREGLTHNGLHDVVDGPHQQLQIRAVGDAAESVRHLFVEPIPVVPEAAVQARVETLEQALAPADLVNPRASWGARAPACQSADAPRRIYLHHTVTPFRDALSPEARMRQIQAYHMDTQGWCDIGYHYVVSPDGRIWQGRPENRLGTHVANHNTNSTGISFMGNYMEDHPTDRQLANTGRLVRWLRDTYGVARDLIGHRDTNATACPGDHLYAKIGDIERLSDEGGGDPDPDPDPDPVATGAYRGVVYEAPDSGRRIPGATVSVEGRAERAVSSANGAWAFDLPAGTYTVWAEAAGYERASSRRAVVAGEEVWGSIGLSRAVAPDPDPDPGPDPGPGPDVTPPTVDIEEPRDGTTVRDAVVRVAGRVSDDRDEAILQVEVAGEAVDVRDGRFARDVLLEPGANRIAAFAVDQAGNLGVAQVTVHRDRGGEEPGPDDPAPDDPAPDDPAPDDPAPDDPAPEPPAQGEVVTIQRPRDGEVLSSSPVVVAGTVADPRIAVVEIGGSPFPVDGGLFSVGYGLEVGANRIVVTAALPDGRLDTASVTVVYDPDAAGPDPEGDPAGEDPAGAAEPTSGSAARGAVGCAQAAPPGPAMLPFRRR